MHRHIAMVASGIALLLGAGPVATSHADDLGTGNLGTGNLGAGPTLPVQDPPASPPDGGDGEQAPYRITADTLEYEKDRDLYVARGNVVLRQGDRVMHADWMTFSNETQRGVASGNVIIRSGGDTLYTEFAELDISNLTGVLFDARFDDEGNQLRLRGAEIAKTGDQTYRFKDGQFTSCRCPDDDARKPWEIKAGEANLEVGGYGTAKNTTFEVLGVPILWLPWMIYPLKTERESGFLLPSGGLSGRNGAEVGLPFFWAARHNVNLIVTPRWMSKRGFKGDLDLEYVYGEESTGEIFGSFLYDQKIEPDNSKTPFDKWRWATQGSQDAQLPYGWRAKADFRFISDNQYLTDFSDLSEYRADRFLESKASLGNQFGGTGQYGPNVSAWFADDLQNPDDQDRDQFLLQRLPHATFEALPTPLPGFLSRLVPSMDVAYTYFTGREDAVDVVNTDMANGGRPVVDDFFIDTGIDGEPDSEERGPGGGAQGALPDGSQDNFGAGNLSGTEGDTVYQEGEPLADKGHRVVIAPRLSLPLRLADAVELYPEVAWYQTLYQSDLRGFEERGLLTARADLRMRFQRRFGNGDRHLLEPFLSYAYVSGTSQKDNPVFVPETATPQQRIRQLDFINVVRDPADRIPKANRLTLNFLNRFFGKAREGGAAALLADFTLSGGYDFAQKEWGNIYLDGRAYPWTRTRMKFSAGFDPGDGRLTEGLAEVRWDHERGYGVDLAYRYLRDSPRFFEDFPYVDRFDGFRSSNNRINQGDLSLYFTIVQRLLIRYRIAYSFERSLLLGNQGSIEYLSRCRCWAAGFEVHQDRSSGVRIALIYRLMGLGSDDDASGGARRARGSVGLPSF